jgi:hypothetical protein
VAKVHDNGGIIGKTVDFNDTGTYTTGNKKNSGIWNIGAAVKTEPPASYDILIVDYSGSEDNNMRFVLNTSNVPNGTTVGYTLSGTGITASDFTSGSLTGTATVLANSALITVDIAADALTEGTETVTITLDSTDSLGNQTGSLSTNTTITDTSKTVAYLINSFSDTTPNEGTTVTVNYRVSNSMETLYWTINGTTNDFNAVNGASAFSSTTTSGDDTWYYHTITFNVLADSFTEGNEAFTFSLRSGSTSGTVQATQAFTVQDTSKTIAYSIFSFSDTTPNEGDTVNVEMRVSNSNPNIYWMIDLITTADVSATSGQATYIGTTTIGNDTFYRYTASFTIVADTTTEGNEAYTFYMRTGSTSGTVQATQAFTIQDTSLDPPSGGGTGLSDVLATYTGQYSTSLWQQVDLSSSFSQFVGSTGRLVFQYTSGTSFRGDIQLDDINIANNNYSFEINGENWQTTTDGSTTTTYTDTFYQGLAWSSVGTGTTVNRWNRDSGGTGSSSTGLASADAGSWYLYVETSSPGYSYKVSWLRSPEIVLDTNTLNFALGRYGSNIGTLRVFWETTVPAVTALYSFTSHTFTSPITGPDGPTLQQATDSYDTTTNQWLLDTQYFNMTTQGIQEWTVPEDGTYRITAIGATGGIHGGSYNPAFPGAGATAVGEFTLTSGQVLNLVVGQKPSSITSTSGNGAGGGGGSWVYQGAIGGPSLLMVAGGGGGTGHGGASNKGGNGKGGSATTDSVEITEGEGFGINFRYSNRSCGNKGLGQGGKSAQTGGFTTNYRSGGGGAGWLSDGDDYSGYGQGGDRFIGGASEDNVQMAGGFGGGGGSGGSGNSGGGGGGYTGGGSGDGWKSINAGGNTSNSWGGGAGGGTFISSAATNPSTTAGNSGINYADTQNGSILIEKI